MTARLTDAEIDRTVANLRMFRIGCIGVRSETEKYAERCIAQLRAERDEARGLVVRYYVNRNEHCASGSQATYDLMRDAKAKLLGYAARVAKP
jgi:hypothetical protein